MMGFAAERVWDGETCCKCGRRLGKRASIFEDNYFCSDRCLGAYLVDKNEEDIEFCDFITQEALDEREREDWDDYSRDAGGKW